MLSRVKLCSLVFLVLYFCSVESKMDSDSSSSEQLGGGAINEKQRTFQQHKNNVASGTSNNNDKEDAWDPSDNLSHMLHALVGLDRYPNYLSRLNNDDVISIERALEETLIKVR